MAFYEVAIMILFNVQLPELGKFFKGGNRPSESVVGQISACNGRLVCVASDGVPLHEQVGFFAIIINAVM